MSVAVVDSNGWYHRELFSHKPVDFKDTETAVERRDLPFIMSDDETDWFDESSFLSSVRSNGSSPSKRRNEDDGSSSDGEPRHKRVKRRSEPSSRSSLDHLCLPRPRDNFLDFCHHPQTAFVDKRRFAFKLPNQFRYILLRPPKFGKTTFLSTLSQFYDVHGVRRFQEYFEMPEATEIRPSDGPDHSQHLCLSFTFWSVNALSSAGDFGNQLGCDVLFALESFLVKYSKELGLSHPHTYLTNKESDPLKSVFDLVRSREKTLFVGVDSYDTLILESMSSHLVYPDTHQSLVTPEDVEHLLDLYFWGPLQGGCDVIAKLFVTGTLSLQTPKLRDLVVPCPDLRTCCGFTETEAAQFTRSILHETTFDIAELRTQCGDYNFSSDESSDDLVLHPQKLIDRISELSSQQPEGHPFRLLSSLLDLLPLDSEIPNAVTLEALVELIINGGVVDVHGDLEVERDLDGSSVFWGALYHAGALTHARGSKATLRVANSEVLSLMHSRIDDLVRERYRVFDNGREQFHFLTALAQYELQNHQPLLDVLSKVLCDQMQRSLGGAREPSLRGVLELIMRNASLMSCEHSKLLEPVILLPSDTTCARVAGLKTEHVFQWELTTLSLFGLWQAANPNDTDPSRESLRELHEKLCQEDEDTLLTRQYSVWSDSLHAMETVPVGSFFKAEAEHTQLIAVGGTRVLRRAVRTELTALPSLVDGEGETGDQHEDHYHDQDEDDFIAAQSDVDST